MNHIANMVGHLFKADTTDPRMARAQLQALSKQLPLMYFTLLLSSFALAYTHYSVAPKLLTVYLPGSYSLYTIYRSSTWLQYIREEISFEETLKILTKLNYLSVVVSVSFTLWSISLFEYGGAYERAHVAFYMAITVITCIFCLASLPQAARIVTVIVNGTFIVFFSSQGIPFFSASAANVSMVCIGMLVIMSMNYKNLQGRIDEQHKSEALAKKSEALAKENDRLANIDSLTDLPNRRAFYHELEQVFEGTEEPTQEAALGIIDLDGFKPVNDLYGHLVGDKLLSQVADRLRAKAQSDGDIQFFRLGGDEFAFISYGTRNLEMLATTGNQLCKNLATPFIVGDLNITVEGTIGIAQKSSSVNTATDLFDRADHALYEGKRNARGTCQIYSQEQDAQLHRVAAITLALKTDDLKDEIFPVFQPIVDIRNNQVVAMETLARWRSPNLGLIQPNEFIPIAEQAGYIGRITCIIVEKALAEAENWPKNMRLSINLSAHDLTSDAILLKLLHTISQSSFSPRRISFEITETALSDDFHQVPKVIADLQKLGCSISLDDFGTGYSNLSRMHRMPLSIMKIDRSLITDIREGRNNYEIVDSLVVLAQKMRLQCIAEGVETQSELNVLTKLGINYVQGYYFSPPVESSLVSQTIAEIQAKRMAS